jgi:tetratricopeptide (TPR) repeat protein
MQLSGKSLQLRKNGRRSNPRLIILLLTLIGGGLFLINLQDRGEVQPLFIPTPTATRIPLSYAEEAEAQFAAGNLATAIPVYLKAVEGDPTNVDYWVALARIQIYAQQYEEALKNAETALLASPNSAKAKAVYAWALYWNDQVEEAQAAAVQAIALDKNYAPAHAYYSEILNDASIQRWEQGAQEAELALSLDPTSVDAHRAMGLANESVGNYEGAIMHYKNALAINPNLINLYIRLGLNYRVLQRYDEAIAAFSKASAIDPFDIGPYLSLSRTYYQIDDFGSAIQYLEEALSLQPENPDIHGRLGLIYFRRQNYEGAEPELELAVKGGPYKVSDELTVEVQGMELGDRSKEYYYTLGNLYAYYRKCAPDQAPALLEQVLAAFPDDPTVISSYETSMETCRNVLAGTLVPQAGATTPETDLTVTPTP